jgi:hypothetical protein
MLALTSREQIQTNKDTCPMFDWVIANLSLSLSANPEHHIAPWASWHARLMVLSWGIVLPVGVLIARFYKITPSQDWPKVLDNKFWWYSHRTLQYLGISLMSIGVWFAWGQGGLSSAGAYAHSIIGWVLLVAGWLQVLSSMVRGTTDGDHYHMTSKRLAFERFHKLIGWCAIALSIIGIILGLFLVDAPRWMLLVMAIWWLSLGVLFARLQQQGRCVDTYQAIWGPDLIHPGNRVKPTGWGVRRVH